MIRYVVWGLAMVICAALVCSAGSAFLLYLGKWIGHDDEDEDVDVD